jgi:hypothetical protein
MELATAAIMILATIGLFGAAIAMTRHPRRWRSLFLERTWLRAMAWAAGLSLAALLGSALAGGTLTNAVLLLGGGALLLTFTAWTLAKTFGGPD